MHRHMGAGLTFASTRKHSRTYTTTIITWEKHTADEKMMEAYGILQRRRAKRGRERTSHVAGTDRAKRYEVTASVTGAFFIFFF